ncbi:MAG TPA: S8 family serine peptidase, partial [Blastocatellia bacterium]|nr:S8 family serine peptidase [Blastocatellia bacterium]
MSKGRSKAQPSGKSSQKRSSQETAQHGQTNFGLGPQVRAPKTLKLTQTDPNKKPFTPEILDKTVIAIPLLEKFQEEVKEIKKKKSHPDFYQVIIDVNLEYHHGRAAARNCVMEMIEEIINKHNVDPREQRINKEKSRLSQQYVFARLSGGVIQELVDRDSLPDEEKCKKTSKQQIPFADKEKSEKDNPQQKSPVTKRAIYRIWPDFQVKPLILKSISTVKADAARNSFAASGEDIVWAVLDSGIDEDHPHFSKHKNLTVPSPLDHRDFTDKSEEGGALVDLFGHGTHVAGIIAGEMTKEEGVIIAESRHRDETGEITAVKKNADAISGMAPKCKLISMKVLDKDGVGQASSLIAAIEAIQEINGDGRRIRIHGVNMSVGYDFEPEWFACGQSPLCVEVNRLVKSGVVVVVAAGNTGYGFVQDAYKGAVMAGLGLTINDPGNAEFAITVGSTHRDSPHIYGVSYFSSKGPTGDGRIKPDLVAPGEKIISCAAGARSMSGDGPTSAANTDDHPPAVADATGSTAGA